MKTPPTKLLLAAAVCSFVIIGCELEKPTPDGAPAEAPAPPAELTNSITIDEVASPDQIVFHSDDGTPREIYRMNRNGSGLTRLTNNLRSDTGPRWTADGSRVVFQCEGSICAIDPTGADKGVLFNREGSGLNSFSDPTLSPSGKILAMAAFDKKNTWDIYLYNLETKVLTNLTQTPGVAEFTPVWHPLGGLAWVNEVSGILYNSGDSDEVFTLSDDMVDHPYDPDFTPDGNKMVYQGTSGGDGQRDIFVTDFSTNTTTKITQTATVSDYSPTVSPDGTKVAYARKDQASDADDEIYTMNIDGTGVSRLTFNNVQDEKPDWGAPQVMVSMGPDVTAAEGNPPATQTPFTFEVKLSQAATSNVTVNYTVTSLSATIPTDVASGSGTVTFSPGQKSKTVTVQVTADAVDETSESFKVTLSSPQGAVLGDYEARGVIENDDSPPSPSPTPSATATAPPTLSDDGQIAWTSDQNGDYDIWVKGLDGSNIRHVTSSSDTEASPDFSPDGEMIVFHGGAGAPDIYWVPSDGSAAPTKIQGLSSSADVTPTWSPDGSKVGWASLGGSVNLVQATPPNGSPSLLYDAAGDESYPDWETLYNGNEGVAFQEQDGADFNLLLLNRTTGTVTDYGSGLHPEISPDGRKLAFSSDRDGNHEIYVLDLTVSGATPVRLTTATGEDVGPSWSPDGSSIAFTSHRDGNAEIYIMTATGGQQTNFTNRPVDDFEPSWGLDPDAPAGARAEDPSYSVPAKGRHNTDPALSVGILLPTMLGAAWVLHRRRR